MSHAGKESLWPISQREKAPRLKSSEGEGQSRFGISHAYVNDPHNLLNRPLSAEYRTSVSGLLEQSVSRRREFYSPTSGDAFAIRISIGGPHSDEG
jgi:hypothetical protein